MRRFGMIVLLVALLFSVTACNQEPKEAFVYDEAQVKTLSNQYAEEMAKGNFDNTIKAFSATMSKALTRDALIGAWKSVVDPVGAYQLIYQNTVAYNNDLAVSTVILQYELNGVQVKLTFDHDYKLHGLWLNYFSIEEPLQVNDTFEESEIQIGSGEEKLDGILTKPSAAEAPPVVILVQGSGPQDMHETVGAGNQPFKDLAQGLAAEGIASIRFNKRYYQYPPAAEDTAAMNAITVQQEVTDDVDAAIVLAKETFPNSEISVIGHSLGGMLAPYIATQNPDLKSIVIMAGTPRKLEDVMVDQTKDALDQNTTMSAADKAAYLAQLKEEAAKVKKLTEADLGTLVLQQPVSYWLSLNAIDTGTLAAELEIPILILQGDADFQVKADVDFLAWEEYLGTHLNVTYKLYEDLNHLFMPTTGAKDVSDYNTPAHIPQQVILDIAAFLK